MELHRYNKLMHRWPWRNISWYTLYSTLQISFWSTEVCQLNIIEKWCQKLSYIWHWHGTSRQLSFKHPLKENKTKTIWKVSIVIVGKTIEYTFTNQTFFMNPLAPLYRQQHFVRSYCGQHVYSLCTLIHYHTYLNRMPQLILCWLVSTKQKCYVFCNIAFNYLWPF